MWKITVTGTGATVTIKGYLNDVEKVTYDDTDGTRITSGQYAGMIFYSTPGILYTDWEAGNL